MNTENEVALLGAILRDGSKYDGLRELITPVDFEWHCHGWIWEAFEKLHSQGMQVDTITVGDELERAGKLTEFQIDGGLFSGRAALGRIRSEGNPRAVETYAHKVLDYSAKRQLTALMNMGANWAANGRTANDIILDLSQRLSKIKTYDSKAAKHTLTLSEAVSGAYDYTEKASRGMVKAVKTGFMDLDHILKGLYGGDVYYIAARPGQGKTAFLASLVKNAAEDGRRVAVFELEMTAQAIAMRLIAQQSGVPVDRQRSGELEPADWEKYTEAVEVLGNWSVFINDLPAISPARIRQEMRRIGQVDLLVIDYIQLASSDERDEKRYAELAKIARAFKVLAKEFDIPVVTAAQLSRAVEARKDAKPILSDLKESGGLEENADVVAFLHKPEDRTDNSVDVIIAKHRNGRVGTVQLAYIPERTRFENLYKPKGTQS
jgi:replicative DNA helicase